MNTTKPFFSTTRITGLFYLGMAITGMIAFLFIKENIFVSGDAIATAGNLIEQESLARWGIATELLLVSFQALAAIWFYKIFKKVNSEAAGMITVLGMVNAIMILASSAMWLTSLEMALMSDAAISAFYIFSLHESLWTVAGIFFGLWLIPMGYLVTQAKMPKALGWFLMIGGVGYILSTLGIIIMPDQATFNELLVIPASIGEFWIIGYLLFKGKIIA